MHRPSSLPSDFDGRGEEMKVLILGQGGFGNIETFISHAFTSLGWNISRYDMYQLFSRSKKLNSYIKMATARYYEIHRLIDWITGIESTIISIVKTEKPDIIIVVKGEIFPSTVGKRISEEFGTKVVLWFPDDPRYLQSLLIDIAPSFDHVVVSSKSTVPILKTRHTICHSFAIRMRSDVA